MERRRGRRGCDSEEDERKAEDLRTGWRNKRKLERREKERKGVSDLKKNKVLKMIEKESKCEELSTDHCS